MDYYNLQGVPMPNDNSYQYLHSDLVGQDMFGSPFPQMQQQQTMPQTPIEMPLPQKKKKKRKKRYTNRNIMFAVISIFVLLVFIGWISQRNASPPNYNMV